MFNINCIFVISDKSSPLLNRLIYIFKVNRLFHREVALHGDTAGSSGVCSGLQHNTHTAFNQTAVVMLTR